MAQIIERKSKDGSVTFFARIRRKGAKAVCASFKRKTDARLWIAETENAILDGRYTARSEGRKHTVKEMIERFHLDYPMDAIRRSHLKLWEDEIGFKLLSDITPACINEVIARWKREPNNRGEPRRAAVLNRYLSSLSVVFTAASRDWEWMSRNPIREVRRQKEPRGRIRFLSDSERERLLEAARTSYCPFLYLVIVLALSTGMRKTEIMSLRWEQVDFSKSVLILMKTKNDEPRRVALRGLALELLKQHARIRRIDNDFIFPGEPGNQVHGYFDIRKAWVDARDRAKIENFVFHDLRHSCASYLAMGGATLLEVAEVLGHKTLSMVKRYSHLAESHTANVVERMNEKIFGSGL